MSLIGDPPIVFLDEPTTGLDPEARLEVWHAIRDLAGERHDRVPHHAVPRRGRATGRSDRDPARGPDHRERHPRRAQGAAAAREGRVRREAADPRGRLPRRRRPRRHHQGAADDHALRRRHRRCSPGGRCATSPAASTRSSPPRSCRSRSCCCSCSSSAARSTPGRPRTSNYLLPGILIITVASGRLLHGVPALPRPAERHLRAVPLHADRPVVGAVGARVHLAGRHRDVGDSRRRRSRRYSGSVPVQAYWRGSRLSASSRCSPWR